MLKKIFFLFIIIFFYYFIINLGDLAQIIHSGIDYHDEH